mmetsp:Transcript_25241/g.54361  ORF Transcript_25241/g.54361 Transcript_25241/m.54361 type:complete len:210 (+) Transcript_25241:1957-2586(+)
MRTQLGRRLIHFLQRQGAQRLFRDRITLLRTHESMSIRNSLHQIRQLIRMRYHIPLCSQLFRIGQQCRSVPFHLSGRDAKQSQLANFRNGLFHSLLPTFGFRSHVETAHGTSLACRVQLVEFHKRKSRIVRSSTDIQSNLQCGQTHTTRQSTTERCHILNRFHGPFGKQMERKVLQQLVFENVRSDDLSGSHFRLLQELDLVVQIVGLL